MKTVFWIYPARPVERQAREAELPRDPSYKQLCAVLDPLFFKRHWEHVFVYMGEEPGLGRSAYRDMFVDERGQLDGFPRNEAATAIYRRNVLMHEPAKHPDPEALPDIVGLAVLFERQVWF